MSDSSTIYQVLDCARSSGLEFGVPFRDYQTATVAMNPSSLVHGFESMRALKWHWDHPQPSSPSMAFGTAVHTMCLEPKKFEQQYAIWTEGSRRTMAYKDFAADSWLEGKKVLTEDESEAVQHAAIALVAHAEVQELVSCGVAEVAVYVHETCGIQCKGRVDWITGAEAKRQAIVDIKTARDVTERGRGRDFFRYHYDVKLGLYQRWIEAVTGIHYPVCVVWIKNKPPYDVVIDDGWIPQAVLDQGVAKALRLFDELKRCLLKHEWPAPGGPLYVPTWEMVDDELTGFDEVEDED